MALSDCLKENVYVNGFSKVNLKLYGRDGDGTVKFLKREAGESLCNI